MRLVIVGGSDGGISAALRAREVDPSADVTVVVADAYPNYSICGIPYHVSGDVPDWRSLAHGSRTDLEATGMHLLLNTRATSIDVDGRRLLVTGEQEDKSFLSYDALIVATGATPIKPPIAGLDDIGPADGLHLLHTMDDTFALMASLERRKPATALIVGAGYIGLEMAEALRARQIDVTVVERLAQVLPTVDVELGTFVKAELARNGVEVCTKTTVTAIKAAGGDLMVSGSDGFERTVGIVLVVVGVTPDAGLLQDAGAAVSPRCAAVVDRHMATSLLNVYAAGDCVITHHRLLTEPSYLPLGTTAHKQGRVAGEVAVGGTPALLEVSAPKWSRCLTSLLHGQVCEITKLSPGDTSPGQLRARPMITRPTTRALRPSTCASPAT